MTALKIALLQIAPTGRITGNPEKAVAEPFIRREYRHK